MASSSRRSCSCFWRMLLKLAQRLSARCSGRCCGRWADATRDSLSSCARSRGGAAVGAGDERAHNPYRGLQIYTAAEKNLFFGREGRSLPSPSGWGDRA